MSMYQCRAAASVHSKEHVQLPHGYELESINRPACGNAALPPLYHLSNAPASVKPSTEYISQPPQWWRQASTKTALCGRSSRLLLHSKLTHSELISVSGSGQSQSHRGMEGRPPRATHLSSAVMLAPNALIATASSDPSTLGICHASYLACMHGATVARCLS